MNPAICCGNKIIPKTTITASQRSALPTNLPRTAHCLARCCCQNPNPIDTTESPRSQGRSVVENALAAPAPKAAANPSGRQHPIVAMELRIATNETEMPVPCFKVSVRPWQRISLAESFQRAEAQFVSIRDRVGNLFRSSAIPLILIRCHAHRSELSGSHEI